MIKVEKNHYSLLTKKFRIKYFLDRCLAAVLIILTSPIFLIAAFLIKLDGCMHPENKGSIFYLEPRISAGKIFKIIKFRTVPEVSVKWIKEDIEKRSITGCEPKTWAGKIILNWYMDELPQIINVLKGDMSFVGPRPHIIDQSKREINEFNLAYRNYIKAGLLGVVQAMKRDEKYKKMFEEMTKTHQSSFVALNKMEASYADKCLDKSPIGIVLFDLYLTARGIITVLKGVVK